MMKIVYCFNSIKGLGGIQQVIITKANALAEKIKKLIEDEPLRIRMGKDACEKAENYKMENIISI